MRRIVYCPNDSLITEAIELSKSTSLPIQVGKSSSTDMVKCNNDVVSIVNIPEKNNVVYNSIVNRGMHQCVDYENEFCEIGNTVSLLIDGIKYLPIIREKHFCKFIFVCNISGNFAFSLMFGDEELETRDFYVN